MTRLLLTVPEAAEALAISRSKLYELLASGAIASIRIDGSRRIQPPRQPVTKPASVPGAANTSTGPSRPSRTTWPSGWKHTLPP